MQLFGPQRCLLCFLRSLALGRLQELGGLRPPRRRYRRLRGVLRLLPTPTKSDHGVRLGQLHSPGVFIAGRVFWTPASARSPRRPRRTWVRPAGLANPGFAASPVVMFVDGSRARATRNAPSPSFARKGVAGAAGAADRHRSIACRARKPQAHRAENKDESRPKNKKTTGDAANSSISTPRASGRTTNPAEVDRCGGSTGMACGAHQQSCTRRLHFRPSEVQDAAHGRPS